MSALDSRYVEVLAAYADSGTSLPDHRDATISQLQAEIARMREAPTLTDREIAIRFASACDAIGGQRVMAKKIGLSDSFISMVINGQKPASDRILAELGLERVSFVRAALGGSNDKG